MSKKEAHIIVMNFSGIYESQEFYKNRKMVWMECKELEGTNCYCDEMAARAIQEQIKSFSYDGIHYIDSGNYHYISRLWLEKLDCSCRLLVFDNHTDLQPPAFGGLLSCGGWIAAVIEELPFIKEVILVGPDEEAFAQVDPELKKKIRYFSREQIKKNSFEQNLKFFETLPADLPLYISVDKDVLSPQDACTTWSQGDMRLSELMAYLECVFSIFQTEGMKILGMDICGECDMDQAWLGAVNEEANRQLLELFIRKEAVEI